MLYHIFSLVTAGMGCTSPSLHVSDNAKLVNTAEALIDSSQATVVCKEGFVQTGGSNIFNCIDGGWSGEPLTCSKHFEKGNS